MVTRPTCILFSGGRMSFQWCVFLSANKSSPSLPLEYSYVHSFKSLPVTTMFNGTSIYRCSQRPLNLPTLEQEAGLAEPEPAMCPCNKKANSILSCATRSVASRLMEMWSLPSPQCCSDTPECRPQFWAPQHKRQGHAGEKIATGHNGDQWTGAHHVSGKAEAAGPVHPRAGKVRGILCVCINTWEGAKRMELSVLPSDRTRRKAHKWKHTWNSI